MSTIPQPHTPWCPRPNSAHSVCHLVIKRIDISPGLVAIVELTHAPRVPSLVSLLFDRGVARTMVPLAAQSANELGGALVEAADLATKV